MSFGKRLKELRKEKRLTQMDFAKLFQISAGAIGMWEIDKRQPDNATLGKIADFFNVSVDYLLGRETDNKTKQPPISFTEREKLLLQAFSVLTEEMQEYVIQSTEKLAELKLKRL